MKIFYDIQYRQKRTLINSNLSIKNYFLHRHCITYTGVEQSFQFDDRRGIIDISNKLRIIVSINALNSLTDRYQGKSDRSFPLYILIVRFVSNEFLT